MDKKEIRQIIEEQNKKFRKEVNEDFKLHVGVLVEDFDSKLELIAEQHSSIMRVLENHTTRLKAIEEKLVEIDIRLDHMEEKVNYEDFKGLEKRVALLETRLSRRA